MHSPDRTDGYVSNEITYLRNASPCSRYLLPLLSLYMTPSKHTLSLLVKWPFNVFAKAASESAQTRHAHITLN